MEVDAGCLGLLLLSGVTTVVPSVAIPLVLWLFSLRDDFRVMGAELLLAALRLRVLDAVDRDESVVDSPRISPKSLS